MSKEIIKKVELDLNGKKVTLTMKQMKLLKEALDDMFGKQVIHEYHDWWQWYQPIRTWYLDDRPQWTYTSTSDGSTLTAHNSCADTLSLKVG